MRWTKELVIGVVASAIVAILDRAFGSRFAVFLLQPIAIYVALLSTAVAFLLGLAPARRRRPSTPAVPLDERRIELLDQPVLPIPPDEPRKLPRDQERALELLLEAGTIQASELRDLLGATPPNFELL